MGYGIMDILSALMETPLPEDIIKYVIAPMVYQLNHRERYRKVMRQLRYRPRWTLKKPPMGLVSSDYRHTYVWYDAPYAEFQKHQKCRYRRGATIGEMMAKLGKKPKNRYAQTFHEEE
jgi:hypothetical protein